jgi:hypothetical protein
LKTVEDRSARPTERPDQPARSFGASWGTKKVVGKCQATISRIVTTMRIVTGTSVVV